MKLFVIPCTWGSKELNYHISYQNQSPDPKKNNFVWKGSCGKKKTYMRCPRNLLFAPIIIGNLLFVPYRFAGFGNLRFWTSLIFAGSQSFFFLFFFSIPPHIRSFNPRFVSARSVWVSAPSSLPRYEPPPSCRYQDFPRSLGQNADGLGKPRGPGISLKCLEDVEIYGPKSNRLVLKVIFSSFKII